MLWRRFAAIPSRCGSTRQYTSRAVGAVNGDHITQRIRPASRRTFSTAVYRRQTAEAQSRSSSGDRVHDIASTLKETSSDPVPLTVLGSIRTIRNQKKHSFVKLGDGSTTAELQVLLSPAQSEGLATGTLVRINGILKPCPPTMKQSHELHAQEIVIVGSSDAETYPIQKKYHTAEFLRTLPHLRLRTPWNGLMTRLRSELEWSCTVWFRQNGFLRVHPPIITSSDCEGAGEVFTVSPATRDPTCSPGQLEQPFFRTAKYLTVSSQLHLEAYVHTHRAVWTLSPTFRAERSDTPRHLSEFYMLEAEIQTESLSEVMDVVENLLRHIGRTLRATELGEELFDYVSMMESRSSENKSQHQFNLLKSRWEALEAPQPYPRITYTEAISHLQTAAANQPDLFTHKPAWGAGLATEHEKYIAATIGLDKTPVFITNYPTSMKPFYMSPSSPTTTTTTAAPTTDQVTEANTTRATVSNFDLILPTMAELAGGSLREHRHGQLLTAMASKGVSPANLDWYTSLREYGSVPHGGFGLGFDRLLCYLAGEGNVRDVVGWPRWVGRCDG